MNVATQRVIEFLGHPELNFGTEEDVLLLADPVALQNRVASLLDEPQKILSEQHTDDLKEQLPAADWPFIAQEFDTRVNMAARFFDADAQGVTTADAPST